MKNELKLQDLLHVLCSNKINFNYDVIEDNNVIFYLTTHKVAVNIYNNKYYVTSMCLVDFPEWNKISKLALFTMLKALKN